MYNIMLKYHISILNNQINYRISLEKDNNDGIMYIFNINDMENENGFSFT